MIVVITFLCIFAIAFGFSILRLDKSSHERWNFTIAGVYLYLGNWGVIMDPFGLHCDRLGIEMTLV